MRTNISFVEFAPELEPSEAFTAELLAAGRREMQVQRVGQARAQRRWRVAKGLAYAAGVAVMATLWFQVSLEQATGSAEVLPLQAERAAEVDDTQLAQSARETNARLERRIQTLATAVGARVDKPRSMRENMQVRRLQSLEQSIQDAGAALERNPSSARAIEVVNASLQEAEHTTTSLYTER
jgi:hypothetical protein